MQDKVRFAQLVQRLLGVTPGDVRQTSSPDAWFADLPDGRQVVVKTPGWLNRTGGPLVEAWAYDACRRRGIRVPEVIACSEDPECVIVALLPGEPLPGQSPGGASLSSGERAVWANAGADLRTIHEIRLPGFGPLVPGEESPRGEAERWCPFAESACEQGIPHLVDAGYLALGEARLLLRRFETAGAAFHRVTDGRLLHGDLMCTHIFRSACGEYAGIIDFGQAQAGDPLWDLARIPLWDGEAALDALLSGYGHDAVGAEERQLLLPLYLLAFVIHHAAGHDRSDYVRTLLDRSGYRALLR